MGTPGSPRSGAGGHHLPLQMQHAEQSHPSSAQTGSGCRLGASHWETAPHLPPTQHSTLGGLSLTQSLAPTPLGSQLARSKGRRGMTGQPCRSHQILAYHGEGASSRKERVCRGTALARQMPRDQRCRQMLRDALQVQADPADLQAGRQGRNDL